jgi:hypothetical protein
MDNSVSGLDIWNLSDLLQEDLLISSQCRDDYAEEMPSFQATLAPALVLACACLVKRQS